MGKHVPLPSDPTERAAEKKRRFAVYHSAYRKRTKAAYRTARDAKAAAAYRKQRDEDRAEQEQRKAWRRARNLDLIGL